MNVGLFHLVPINVKLSYCIFELFHSYIHTFGHSLPLLSSLHLSCLKHFMTTKIVNILYLHTYLIDSISLYLIHKNLTPCYIQVNHRSFKKISLTCCLHLISVFTTLFMQRPMGFLVFEMIIANSLPGSYLLKKTDSVKADFYSLKVLFILILIYYEQMMSCYLKVCFDFYQ